MLNQITTITDLLVWLPALSRQHDELDGLWEPDLNKEEFLERIIDVFGKGAFIFLEPCAENKLKYVIVMEKETIETYHFWLFYMNKDFRSETKQLLYQLKQFCKDLGVKTVRLSTTRLTCSYERWVQKFGAKKHSITYEITI